MNKLHVLHSLVIFETVQIHVNISHMLVIQKCKAMQIHTGCDQQRSIISTEAAPKMG